MALKDYEPALTDYNGFMCYDSDGALTYVTTDKGDVLIKDVTWNHKVLTRNGFRQVLTCSGVVGGICTPYHVQRPFGSGGRGFFCAPTQEVFCHETQSFIPVVSKWSDEDARPTFYGVNEQTEGDKRIYGHGVDKDGQPQEIRAISSIGMGSRTNLKSLYNFFVECLTPDETPEFYANGFLVLGLRKR